MQKFNPIIMQEKSLTCGCKREDIVYDTMKKIAFCRSCNSSNLFHPEMKYYSEEHIIKIIEKIAEEEIDQALNEYSYNLPKEETYSYQILKELNK